MLFLIETRQGKKCSFNLVIVGYYSDTDWPTADAVFT